eukprot:2072028-Alexandrium_andersonii.AAC.1
MWSHAIGSCATARVRGIEHVALPHTTTGLATTNALVFPSWLVPKGQFDAACTEHPSMGACVPIP